jgi:hypothetical protein
MATRAACWSARRSRTSSSRVVCSCSRDAPGTWIATSRAPRPRCSRPSSSIRITLTRFVTSAKSCSSEAIQRAPCVPSSARSPSALPMMSCRDCSIAHGNWPDTRPSRKRRARSLCQCPPLRPHQRVRRRQLSRRLSQRLRWKSRRLRSSRPRLQPCARRPWLRPKPLHCQRRSAFRLCQALFSACR